MTRLDRRRLTLALGLATLAGYVDAVGYLAAAGYFVSFMSGNTTRFGVDLASRPVQALVPALLIAGFVGGVALGAVAGGWGGARRKRAVLSLVAALLLAAALGQGHAPPVIELGLLVMAMGALNNTFVRDGEVFVGLTYMTGALVKLGRAIGLALLGQGSGARGWLPLALWCALASGAVLGALCYGYLMAAALWLAVAWAAAMLALAWPLES